MSLSIEKIVFRSCFQSNPASNVEYCMPQKLQANTVTCANLNDLKWSLNFER